MTDDERLALAERAWMENRHDERAYLLAFARALLADGGKGEAVYQVLSDNVHAWIDVRKFSYDQHEGHKRILYTAPQAECAPREAQPVAWFEAEESCRGMDIRSINSIIYSTRLHWQVARPQTGNPVWPLYAAPTPVERADADTAGAKPVLAWLVDPGAGSATDKLQRDEPGALQMQDIRRRGCSVTPLVAAPPAPSVADAAGASERDSRIATVTKDLIECLMLWNGQASAGLDVNALAGLRDELNAIAKESGND
jgi:hypothetical protein